MTDIEYLDADTVIEINRAHCGADAGVDRAGVEAAVARAWSGFGDVELYHSLWDKAAVYLHGLATTQHFLDGNKRTAWLAATAFLRVNGEDIVPVDDQEGEQFILDMIADHYEVEKVGDWLYERAAPLTSDLGDRGQCHYCDREGALPGAELQPREFFRRVGDRSGELLQEFAERGETRIATHPFRLDRDLVPGVCARCRDGWMRLVDREGWTVMAHIVQSIELPAVGPWRRALAAWLVKTTLLRSTLMIGVSAEWRRQHARRLRESGRVPAGWTVWAYNLEEPVQRLGAFTYARGSLTTDDSHPVSLTEPTVVQWTFYSGGAVFIVLYNHPDADASLGFEALDAAGASPAAIWPELPPPREPFSTVTLEQAQNFESALIAYLDAHPQGWRHS